MSQFFQQSVSGLDTGSRLPMRAAIFAFSLLAIRARAGRYFESWLIWIAVDLPSIPVYWSRQPPLTALLYLLLPGAPRSLFRSLTINAL